MFLRNEGSSQTWVDRKLLEITKLDGKEVTICAVGNHGKSSLQSREVEVEIRSIERERERGHEEEKQKNGREGNALNKCTILVNSHENLAVGKEEHDFKPLMPKFALFPEYARTTYVHQTSKYSSEKTHIP